MNEIGQAPNGYFPYEGIAYGIVAIFGAMIAFATCWQVFRAYKQRVHKIYNSASENKITVSIRWFSSEIVTTSQDPEAIQLRLAGDHLHIKQLFDNPGTSLTDSLATRANLRRFAEGSLV